MRRTLVLFWIAAGSLHFIRPRFYEAIVPPPLDGYRREVVAASGAAELVGGLAAANDRTRRFARWWLLATIAGVFPANVYMAVRADRFRRFPAWTLWARLPLQGLFAWHAWLGTAPR